MSAHRVLLLAWLPDEMLPVFRREFPSCEFIDGRDPAVAQQQLLTATVVYGPPPLHRLAQATGLRWVQLNSAGVPQDLCHEARRRGIVVSNLAGLYGPSIAEHAFALVLLLTRHLHTALRNQTRNCWDRDIARGMSDMRGRTLALIGLGNIGQAVARIGRAFGMRIVGCRRIERPCPGVDQVYPGSALHAMLAEADYLVVALPLTAHTEGLLGPAEFRAMKLGTIYVNVSRGAVAQEAALLAALADGQVAGAGLDVFATEPLPPDHPFWTMPQVLISPHYSGEVVNQSSLPAERFRRNLHAWLAGRELEGTVNLEWGY
jgi:phosphoglycerate dehydrogenase-like enzyme